jgi:hypothetical protein
MTSPFNAHDKNSLIIALQNVMDYVSKIPVNTPCSNCLNYNEGACKKWDSMVPEETKPIGCESWEFNRDSPPF